MIHHGVPMLMLGSCFTDNIGGHLASQLFDVEINPFGPLYNPLSILRAVKVLANGTKISADDIFMHEGRYQSFLFHSRYSGISDKQATVSVMNGKIASASELLRRTKVVIMTLGTTKAYLLNDGGEVVANCHKLPASNFSIQTLDVEETVEALEETLSTIHAVNQDARLIFTVSPLRYLGDGAHAGQLAKATLLLAVDKVISFHPEMASYFPSYEIMMDDLRDYRFYAEDMRHPSDVAVKYIYELFSSTYFDEETAMIASEASRLTGRLAHRSFSLSMQDDQAQKDILAEKFLAKYPKLRQAYKRYIINGI